MTRIYLDHNATTPLRSEARAAMGAAMDVLGNPSSVHAEGRAVKGLIERARAQVADLVGCGRHQVIFTSGATEAAALAVAQTGRHGGEFLALPTEHECFLEWSDRDLASIYGRDGALDPGGASALLDSLVARGAGGMLALSAANSETGLLAPGPTVPGDGGVDVFPSGAFRYAVVCDITQLAGRGALHWGSVRPSYAVLSAHKLGGPKGVGALINFTAADPEAILRGGGQEMGRRSGTENVIGIAGFGAAAEAAGRDIAAGAWDRVEKLRNILESGLEALSKETIFVGKAATRLPNTSCILTPGWRGETQVMQMDLAGFAISAGSACSSGKVKASRVLRAMGYSQQDAACAIRVSLGLETTEEDILRFVEAWGAKLEKHRARVA